mmetsp:Transcript_73599/g.157828  ORF Transcript_73599/g.157828 Transcript_73599/m.157828 type:complete len:258 (-) Transcript_73599:413-1186(-)
MPRQLRGPPRPLEGAANVVRLGRFDLLPLLQVSLRAVPLNSGKADRDGYAEQAAESLPVEEFGNLAHTRDRLGIHDDVSELPPARSRLHRFNEVEEIIGLKKGLDSAGLAHSTRQATQLQGRSPLPVAGQVIPTQLRHPQIVHLARLRCERCHLLFARLHFGHVGPVQTAGTLRGSARVEEIDDAVAVLCHRDVRYATNRSALQPYCAQEPHLPLPMLRHVAARVAQLCLGRNRGANVEEAHLHRLLAVGPGALGQV